MSLLVAVVFDLPFGFEPELEVATLRTAGLLPELVGACSHFAAPHHATQLPPQLLGEASQAMDGGFVFHERGRSRREFDLVLDLLLLVHGGHRPFERACATARAAQTA